MGRLLFRALPVLGLLVACSDLGGLSEEPATIDGGKPKDSGRTDTGGGEEDAGPTPEGPRCDKTKPFEAPTLVTQFDPTSDFVKGAIASPDELEAFYLRYASGEWDLRHSRRGKKSDPWGPVEIMTMSPRPAAYLSLSAGGLKLYMWNLTSPYRATRVATSDSFGVPAKFDVASGPGPFVVNSDDVAYFAKYANMDGGGVEQFIRRGPLDTYGFSTTSSIVPNIHKSGFNDDRPVLNTSETVMYFASNRPGTKGLADVWVSRRSSKSEELGAPVHVPELSTEDPDSVTWVAEDECEVFLDRSNHVYHARRPL